MGNQVLLFRGRVLAFATVCAMLACSPAPSPAVTGAAVGGDEPWVAQWNALIEAAKKEGTVVVKGNPDESLRTEFPKAFKDRFGIEVEYLATSSSEFAVKIERERAAGVYSTDVVLGGTVLYGSFLANQWLEPIPPTLVHPDARDGTKWVNGKQWYADPDQQYLLRLASTVATNVHINTNLVRSADLTSWNDLLRPEFTGKIISDDPEQQSSGHNVATMLYLRLGEDFVRRLYIDQKPVFVRQQRQISDGLARGAYPISLGLNEEEFQRLVADGFPVAQARDIRDLSGILGGSSSLTGLIKDAPHPNAAKLFVNWLAMKEGSEAFGKAANLVPNRIDTDRTSFPAYLIPVPGVDYVDTSDYEFATNTRLPAGARIRALVRDR